MVKKDPGSIRYLNGLLVLILSGPFINMTLIISAPVKDTSFHI
jgi:hypothetical protein